MWHQIEMSKGHFPESALKLVLGFHEIHCNHCYVDEWVTYLIDTKEPNQVFMAFRGHEMQTFLVFFSTFFNEMCFFVDSEIRASSSLLCFSCRYSFVDFLAPVLPDNCLEKSQLSYKNHKTPHDPKIHFIA